MTANDTSELLRRLRSDPENRLIFEQLCLSSARRDLVPLKLESYGGERPPEDWVLEPGGDSEQKHYWCWFRDWDAVLDWFKDNDLAPLSLPVPNWLQTARFKVEFEALKRLSINLDNLQSVHFFDLSAGITLLSEDDARLILAPLPDQGRSLGNYSLVQAPAHQLIYCRRSTLGAFLHRHLGPDSVLSRERGLELEAIEGLGLRALWVPPQQNNAALQFFVLDCESDFLPIDPAPTGLARREPIRNVMAIVNLVDGAGNSITNGEQFEECFNRQDLGFTVNSMTVVESEPRFHLFQTGVWSELLTVLEELFFGDFATNPCYTGTMPLAQLPFAGPYFSPI